VSAVLAYPFGEPDRLRLHPRYAYLREHEPLARVRMRYGDPARLVTGYHDARTVLADPRFSRAAGRDEPRTSPDLRYANLMSLDPPEHTRLRKLVATAFTARRVELLRARAQQTAEGLVDRMVAAGPPADLVECFATPFPLTVMCELFGIPANDRRRFQTWTEAVIATTALAPGKLREYGGRLRAYLARLIRRHRRDGSEGSDAGLLGALLRARDDEDRLSEDELLDLAGDLLALGYETTASQLPNIVYTLYEHPGMWRRLAARPHAVPTAVEELMRYIPLAPHAVFPRYATEDVALPGGTVRAGEPVLVSLAAAGRDGRVFAEPDRLDLDRDPNPHLGFSHGVHHCVGAPLARMELQVGLATLACRLPGLRLAVPEADLVWKRGLIVRGPVALPVSW
jgi:cytochrome P450